MNYAPQIAYRARELAKDPEARHAKESAYSAKWRAANPEKTKASTKKWREANRDRVNQRRREWRDNNIVRALFLEARARAKTRGVDFTITLDDIPPMGDRCPILGHLFSKRSEGKRDHSPSLDRRDPTKGYVPGNVWVIGYRANLIKNDGTADEHELIARAMRKK